MDQTPDLFSMAQSNVAFCARESERRKQEGMSAAAAAKAALLNKAREVARMLAVRNGFVHMDEVNMELEAMGIDSGKLGASAGSVFKGKEWEFAGQFVKSARVTNHSRLLRVWRLRP